MKYCSKCGKEISNNDVFCSECGNKIDKPEKINETKETIVDRKNIKIAKDNSSLENSFLIFSILYFVFCLMTFLFGEFVIDIYYGVFIVVLAILGIVLGVTEIVLTKMKKISIFTLIPTVLGIMICLIITFIVFNGIYTKHLQNSNNSGSSSDTTENNTKQKKELVIYRYNTSSNSNNYYLDHITGIEKYYLIDQKTIKCNSTYCYPTVIDYKSDIVYAVSVKNYFLITDHDDEGKTIYVIYNYDTGEVVYSSYTSISSIMLDTIYSDNNNDKDDTINGLLLFNSLDEVAYLDISSKKITLNYSKVRIEAASGNFNGRKIRVIVDENNNDKLLNTATGDFIFDENEYVIKCLEDYCSFSTSVTNENGIINFYVDFIYDLNNEKQILTDLNVKDAFNNFVVAEKNGIYSIYDYNENVVAEIGELENYRYSEECENDITILLNDFDEVDNCTFYRFDKTTHEIQKNRDTCSHGNGKPVLYLYPEQETNVTVKILRDDLLTTTYPKYSDIWKVIAKPNGDLYDENSNYYYALYWEDNEIHYIDYNTGFYVEKDNAIEFLEEKLTYIGLSDKEKNEFIMYWLPILERNEKSLIYFELTEERNEYFPIKINPTPDSILRVIMHVKKVDTKVDIPEQELTSFERKGFVAVEWGGSDN